MLFMWEFQMTNEQFQPKDYTLKYMYDNDN